MISVEERTVDSLVDGVSLHHELRHFLLHARQNVRRLVEAGIVDYDDFPGYFRRQLTRGVYVFLDNGPDRRFFVERGHDDGEKFRNAWWRCHRMIANRDVAFTLPHCRQHAGAPGNGGGVGFVTIASQLQYQRACLQHLWSELLRRIE